MANPVSLAAVERTIACRRFAVDIQWLYHQPRKCRYGAALRDLVRQPDVSVLGDFFAYSLAQQKGVIEDVMQARIAIECQAIRLACRRATGADFDSLEHALGRIEATIADPVAGSVADHDFHVALVRAAKSDTLASLYAAMAGILTRSHRDRRATVDVDAALKKHLITDHRRIYDAVVARDEEAADRLLRDHFRIGDKYRQRATLEPAAPAKPARLSRARSA